MLLGALGRIFVRNDTRDKRLRLDDAQGWRRFLDRETYAGKSVSDETALQIAAVWACTRITAQAVASLPIGVFEKKNGSRESASDHPLSYVLDVSPNEDQTSLEFWEAFVASLLMQGNAYALKHEARGEIVALEPLPSCRPFRDEDRNLRYRVVDRGKTEEIDRDRVFHVKGFSLGGDEGLSVVRYGAQTFGAAMATDEATAKLFSNGLSVSGILKSEAVLKPDQRTLLQDLMESYVGSRHAGKMMILEAGMDFQAISMNPEDAQMLETRRFQVEEICRWFGTPPIIIGHAAQGQTMWGTGVEQILLSWLATGINPLARRIEKRILKQLFPAKERGRFNAEFNREGLLQMDSAAKAAFLSSMTQNGLMTRNEGRSKINLPAKPGGDALTVQTNLAPLESLGSLGVDQ